MSDSIWVVYENNTTKVLNVESDATYYRTIGKVVKEYKPVERVKHLEVALKNLQKSYNKFPSGYTE